MLIFDLRVGPWPYDTSSYYCEQLWRVFTKSIQSPFKDKNVMAGHDILPQIDNVGLEWASATLTLEVGVWLSRITHRFIITNICPKLFQIPLIDDKAMDRTWKYDRQTDGRTEPISTSIFYSKRRRTINQMMSGN
jgi:hypothetical protein